MRDLSSNGGAGAAYRCKRDEGTMLGGCQVGRPEVEGARSLQEKGDRDNAILARDTFHTVMKHRISTSQSLVVRVAQNNYSERFYRSAQAPRRWARHWRTGRDDAISARDMFNTVTKHDTPTKNQMLAAGPPFAYIRLQKRTANE